LVIPFSYSHIILLSYFINIPQPWLQQWENGWTIFGVGNAISKRLLYA